MISIFSSLKPFFIRNLMAPAVNVFAIPVSRWRCVSLVFLICFITGCTAKLSYRFLDWIVAWSVDDYVSWDAEQQPIFDHRLDALLAWHQFEQLPKYAQFLQSLRIEIEQPVTREALLVRIDQAGDFYYQLVREVEPDALLLLSSLSDQQVQAMKKNLAKSTARLEKKYLLVDAEDQVQRRVDTVEDLVSDLLGRLSAEQKQLIDDWAGRVVGTELWIENRKQWADLFIATLASRQVTLNDADIGKAFAEKMHRLLLEPQTFWRAEYTAASEHNVNVAIDLVLALQETLSPKQRQHLYAELNQWIEVLLDLSTIN